MGTGKSGRFVGTAGESQPYAETYRVVKDMYEKGNIILGIRDNPNNPLAR